MVVKDGLEKKTNLGKEHFLKLLEADNKDFKYCPKLTRGHSEVKGNERQRTKPAIQLFSCTVAKFFRHKFGQLYVDQSKIIELIDAWFDCMNTRIKYGVKDFQCALGVHEKSQLETLNLMYNLVNNMYFPTKKGTLVQKPFQTGIIVSIRATTELFRELKNEGISYLLTSRLNQDCIENVFSQIRQMGGHYSHPTSVEFINRIRKAIRIMYRYSKHCIFTPDQNS